jgi:hypothetical protein
MKRSVERKRRSRKKMITMEGIDNDDDRNETEGGKNVVL